MNTEIVSAFEDAWLVRTLEVIRAGGVVAFPTDTVYGIGSDPFQPDAVKRLYEAKERPVDKAIPILIGSPQDLLKVVAAVPAGVENLIEAYWPGALTLVLEKRDTISAIVSSGNTVGVRIPDHAIALELLKASGPLAVTSANPSGAKEARDSAKVLDSLAGRIDLVVDGGQTPGGYPSTVLDCSLEPPRVLRQGPISLPDILARMDRP